MSQLPKRFLQRESYRLRRLGDAARLLPVAGVIAMAVPLLYQLSDEGLPRTSIMGLYLVGAWLCLIGAAFVLSSRLRDPDLTERAERAEQAGQAGQTGHSQRDEAQS